MWQIQIFWNNSNKSIFGSPTNYEEISCETCLPQFSSEYFTFQYPLLLGLVVPNILKASNANIFRESLTTKIKALWSFKALGTTNQAIQCYIPEDLNHLKPLCNHQILQSFKTLNPRTLFLHLQSFTLNTKNFMKAVSHSSINSDNGS